jgi:hypothetical protein
LVPFLAAATSSKPACASIDRTNRCAPCTTLESPNHPQEHKQVQPLSRLIHPPKKNWKTNSEL